MKIKELYSALCELLPNEMSCDWDNDGLMCCPDPEREVKRVLLALDATAEACELAISEGFDAIVAHHPMIFKPLPAVISPKIIKLIKNDISVISLHTRLDKYKKGVSHALIKRLGLTEISPFADDGIGIIGELSKESDPESFAKEVKRLLCAPFAECIFSDRAVKRVAMVGGDGKDYVELVKELGCDTYVTGSMSYNSMTDASELGINIIAAGHYFTENPVLDELDTMISGIDKSIEIKHFESNKITVI